MPLRPVEPATAVVACSTCRLPNVPRGETPDGVRLIEALQTAQAGDARFQHVQVQAMPCLFACKDGCTVHLRAPGKIGYVLGRFEPDEAAAEAILEYAVHYHASEIGQVPYKQWPQGVKGHFLTRTPPEGFVVE